MSYRLSPKTVAQFSAAAATGLALFGCNQTGSKHENQVQEQSAESPNAAKAEKGKECCMGLNECKGKGGCAVPESHGCAGKNECKGQGGCNMHCPK